ncbi:hypothetical protein ACFQX6_57095 [Streptosporangium lutulentum]
MRSALLVELAAVDILRGDWRSGAEMAAEALRSAAPAAGADSRSSRSRCWRSPSCTGAGSPRAARCWRRLAGSPTR